MNSSPAVVQDVPRKCDDELQATLQMDVSIFVLETRHSGPTRIGPFDCQVVSMELVEVPLWEELTKLQATNPTSSSRFGGIEGPIQSSERLDQSRRYVHLHYRPTH
jgi:hypothetical protein